jgi:hypothetical protein
MTGRLLLATASLASAARLAAADSLVLGEGGFWRCHVTRGTELVRMDSGETKILNELNPASQVKSVGRYRMQLHEAREPRLTETPPADWIAAEFDDSDWLRCRGPFVWKYGEYAPRVALCLRGRFEVRDPVRAGDLALTAAFQGGIVFYLNGTEFARAGLPAGPLAFDTPAEDYPVEAFVTPEGQPLLEGRGAEATCPDRVKQRVRQATVKVPASLLRQGTNVLAVAIHRAPAREIMFLGKERTTRITAASWWSRLGLAALSLTASDPAAVTPNVGRPPGLRVWPQSVLARPGAADYADAAEARRPVRIAGARNGAFAGALTVGHTEPIRGLQVLAEKLEGPQGASLPASAIQFRYALADAAPPRRGEADIFDGLEETAPAEVPVGDKTAGAVQPVWITVRVPPKTPAGLYRGRLTVAAEGVPGIEWPVEVDVADWSLPDPRDFTTHAGMIQSPESVALQYGVPLWSPEHWKYLEKSFSLLGEAGNKVVYITLIRRTHLGNEHGMVRWVRKEGSGVGVQVSGNERESSPETRTLNPETFSPDFTIAEKYLDLAVKHLGRMPMVVLYCWEPANAKGHFPSGETAEFRRQDMPIRFTVLDPATGRLEEAEGPKWGTPECTEFWKPVLNGMRERLVQRGLGKSMMLGLSGDFSPTVEALNNFAAAAPEAPWVIHSHTYWEDLHKRPVGSLASIWGIMGPRDPAEPRDYYGNQRFCGWKNPFVLVFPRAGSFCLLRPTSHLGMHRELAEACLTAAGRPNAKPPGVRGFGRLGADFWNVIGDKTRRASILGRYPETELGALHVSFATAALLAPGRDGAISTMRFEMLREGLQEAEARIAIEKALTAPELQSRVPADVAARLQGLLDERVRDYLRAAGAYSVGNEDWLWFASSGWRARTARLYAAAAEAQRLTAAK